MPLTEAGIYYADTSTTMSIADITAAQATSIGEALTVLQVVNATYGSQILNSTSTYSDTGLTATITPKFATSKILVLVSQAGVFKGPGNAANGAHVKLLRGGTTLIQFATAAGYTNTSSENMTAASTCYLDSPATTTAITYKTQFANNVAASYVGVQQSYATSTITLMEIAA